MPPIHPSLVHFPLALIVFSFVADLIGYFRGSAALRAAGFWSLIGGAIGGVLAVAAGYIDMYRLSLGETHEYVDFHMYVGWVLLIAVILLAVWRTIIYKKPEQPLSPIYLGAASLVLLLTVFQGWYGGEMVYSQGAGVAAADKGTEKPSSGKQRLEAVTFGVEHEEHSESESNSEHKESSNSKSDPEKKEARHNDNHSH